MSGSLSRIAIADSPTRLREHVRSWRANGETVALVPTMGALHAGHLALVARGQAEARRVVVSIFVNPTQFSPAEDLDRYPRTFERDCALLAEHDVDLVYAPTAADMYPDGFCTRVLLEGPARAGLEDAARPHFFAGVATVVTKLLLQALPDAAIFGEKDYQQLRVVAAMVRDLDIPVAIIGEPTVRDADGVALSSRNRFLDTEERHRAAVLYGALNQAVAEIRRNGPIDVAVAAARNRIRDAGAVLDYCEARDASTLAPVATWSEVHPVRLLVAARFGATRLIDNTAV